MDSHFERIRDLMPRIVIVGGGAAGLEVATRLGNRLGKRNLAEVVLIDRSPTHFWKPLLHEVASGQIDASSHVIDFAAHARRNHFCFEQGALLNIDRTTRTVTLDGTTDAEGLPLLPSRRGGPVGSDSQIEVISGSAGVIKLPI